MSFLPKRGNADHPKAVFWRWVLGGLLCCVALVGFRTAKFANAGEPGGGSGDGPASTGADSETHEVQEIPEHNSPSTRFPVSIRRPPGPPRVATGRTDLQGNEVTVACSTCHTVRKPDDSNQVPGDLEEFHGGLVFTHGTVSCLSCHNSNDYDALKLADGSRIEYQDVMTLCAQCHGPQKKDYDHGVHGGMNGYWDLSRGPQTRNNCVDCHNPHTPQFPKMKPTFKPKDRFLE